MKPLNFQEPSGSSTSSSDDLLWDTSRDVSTTPTYSQPVQRPLSSGHLYPIGLMLQFEIFQDVLDSILPGDCLSH